ncbi:TIGR02281 family clan AA aspartic protease [Ningiella sp. W23]|uniref:retropepsin-like aspartic protease family protein n=1 Tax=Ningiella sp. W23 TaxID=3023715 RepID=UPI003757287F
MKALLIWILIFSLAANVYLLWKLALQNDALALSQQNQGRLEENARTQASPTAILDESSSANDADSSQGDLISLSERANTQTENENAIEIASSGQLPTTRVTLQYLRELQKAKNYELLAFYVQSYLRAFPRDMDALLLEAEAYYFTQPLNLALVNYYGLLDSPLSIDQLEQIKKLIDVNTTRIIQQFSGDGSWDLLAAFLEPLIQVDPLNRRYIIALAKAYGMQQQTVLMENVLASLAPDDPRAQRLREDIYRPDENAESVDDELLLTQNDAFEQSYESEVQLTRRRGQYYTQVAVSGWEADLLIDTGASITAVSDQVFEQIDDDDTTYMGTFNVQTAAGMVSRSLYKVSSFTVGDEQLNNVSVMVLPAGDIQGFDGLLGMNIIRRFNITYDPSTGYMRMYKRFGR